VWAAAGFIALLVVPVHLVARVEPSAPAVPGAETAVTDGTAVAVLGTALNADAQAPSESQDRAEARRLKELEKQRDAVQKAVEKAQKAATHEFLQKEIDTALAEREYEKAKLQASTVDAKAIEEKIQAAFRAAAERLAQAQAAQPASQGRQQSSQKSQPPSQGVQPSSQGSQQASQEAIERQKATIDQMAAQIRELERALRQATLDSQVRADTAQAAAVNAQAAALARSQEASRRQAEQRAAVQRRLSEQGAQPGSAPVTAANSERQTVLDAQLAELARTQKIVSDQLQNLARQQETMRDAQMRLTESLENLRRSLERIEGTRTTTPAQPAKK
jgi:colicin import membrane protein